MKILERFKHKTSALMVAILMLLGTNTYAQTSTGSAMSQETMLYITLGLVFLVSILVLVVAIYVLQILRTFIQKELSPEAQAQYENQPGWMSQLWLKWNALKPLEQEEDILLDHNYDGIKELDNHLPPWWKGLFYLTIVYGVIYIMIFHVFKTAPLQEEKYANEIAAADALKASKAADLVVDFDENTVTATTDAVELASGQQFFEAQCAVCHKKDGGGLAGPNLTDQYWKHGGSMSDIYKVIKNGVPNTAMISWESQLNPLRMRNLASYVLTLQGTNPPGALPPDGELYEPEN